MTVLVVQTAFLGDVLLSLPLLSALGHAFPGVRRVLVTTPQAAAVVDGLPHAEDVVVFDKRGRHRDAAARRALSAELRDMKPDWALVPHKSFRTAMLVKPVGAPRMVTFDDASARRYATDRIAYPWPLHDADRQLALLRPMLPDDVWTKERVGSLDVCTEEDRQYVRTILDAEGIGQDYIVVAPGTVWPTKQWPLEHVRTLVGDLRRSGRQVVIVGDASLTGSIGTGSGVVDLCGRTTLRQAAAAIHGARAVVANDSAPIHIASLQGVPVLALFGPTVPEFGFAPYGKRAQVVQRADLACRPCSPHGSRQCPIGTHECLAGILPDTVGRALDELSTK